MSIFYLTCYLLTSDLASLPSPYKCCSTLLRHCSFFLCSWDSTGLPCFCLICLQWHWPQWVWAELWCFCRGMGMGSSSVEWRVLLRNHVKRIGNEIYSMGKASRECFLLDEEVRTIGKLPCTLRSKPHIVSFNGGVHYLLVASFQKYK